MSSAITSRLIFDCSRPVRPARPFGLGVVPVEAIRPVAPAKPDPCSRLRGLSGIRRAYEAGRIVGEVRGPIVGREPVAPHGLTAADGRAWVKGYKRGAADSVRAIDEAFESGRLAAMDDAAPVPPRHYSDIEKGAWIDGFGHGEEMLAAREADHYAEWAERDEMERASCWA